MVRSKLVALGAAIAGLLALSEGRASLHHPDDPMAVPVSAAGVPEPLPFDEFSRRRATLANVFDPLRPLANPNSPAEKSERGKVAERIEKAKKNLNRTPEQSVALAVDLLRFGKPDEAEAAFQGMRRGFLPNITLAHIAIAQNSRDHPTWDRAFEYLDIANETPPPPSVPGITEQQLAWQIKLNRGPLVKLVQARLKESRESVARREKKAPELPPDNELPDAIFPVDFTNVIGPALAPVEQAKFPPDALAVVQQLVLWFPSDPRLYWLLAEVYAAKGGFAEAQRIMDSCVESFKYSNRKVLMQHREAVTKAAKEKGAAAPDEPLLAPTDDVPPAKLPFTMGAVWVYFGVVAVIALFALVRALTKKKNSNGRGPIG